MLYRTPQGLTRAVRFFDPPETSQKLELLGPGEVFVDSDLAELEQEAEVPARSAAMKVLLSGEGPT